MAKRIYLSPERRPNPHGPYWGYPGVYEHDVCCEIAEYCKEALIRCGFEVKIARPEDNMEKRVAEGISWGANYYMPIHTNAATAKPVEGTAQGPTVLRYGYEGGVSDRACKMTYNQLMAIYPRNTKRGVYAQNAFYEIRMTPMLSVYPEIAFHDNGEDAKWIVENKKEIGIALCKGVCQWFGVNYVEPPVTNPNTGAIEEPTVPKSDYDKVSAECTAWKQKYNSLKAVYDKVLTKIEELVKATK